MFDKGVSSYTMPGALYLTLHRCNCWFLQKKGLATICESNVFLISL